MIDELPTPSRFATYPHDHSAAVGRFGGPDTTGAFVTVTRAEYDPATDTTRLGFAYGLRESRDPRAVGSAVAALLKDVTATTRRRVKAIEREERAARIRREVEFGERVAAQVSRPGAAVILNGVSE